jgi:hypothetical protein
MAREDTAGLLAYPAEALVVVLHKTDAGDARASQ